MDRGAEFASTHGAERHLLFDRWIALAERSSAPGNERTAKSASKICHGVLLATLIVWTAARFFWLGKAPSGFYDDEQNASLHAICVAEGGVDAKLGQYLPLFFPTYSSTIHSATWAYSAALATKLLGPSREVFRGVAAAYTFATTLLVYAVTRRLFSKTAATWALLCATLSPWAFQFSRIAWDDPLYPFWMLAGVYLLLTAQRPLRAAIAGVCFSLAAYSYLPGCFVAPLVLCTTLILGWWRGTVDSKIAAGAILGAGFTVPYLTTGILFGPLLARYREMSLFSSSDCGVLCQISQFSRFLLLHFTPSFLFTTGDPVNRMLSTQRVGVLSVLDIIGVFVMLPSLFIDSIRGRRSAHGTAERWYVIAGICIAVTPAALTRMGLPHPLRTLGAWPFYAIAAGVGLEQLVQHGERMPALLLAAALAYSGYYLTDFFVFYPTRSSLWLHERDLLKAREAAAAGTWDAYIAKDPLLRLSHRRYYTIAAGIRSCVSTISEPSLPEPMIPPLVGQSVLTATGLGLVAALERRWRAGAKPLSA